MLRDQINLKVESYNQAIANASTDKVAMVLLREKKRFLCLNDLFYLCCLTGNDKIALYPSFYKPFCDEVSLMNWKIVKLGIEKPNDLSLPLSLIEEDLSYTQRLYLAYRTFFKTTVISKVHSLQLLLNFPNINICLAHNKQENASDILMTIKNYFLTTEIKRLFPECIPSTKEWGNMSGFNLANRTNFQKEEASIEAVGVDTEITGRHYKVAKKNDLVTEKSVWTEEQIKKTLEWDERFNIGNFDDPQIKLQDYEGTRYGFIDLYSVKKNDPTIKLVQIPLVKDLELFKGGDDSQISHPERFDREGVLSMMGNIWTFMCQMQQEPADPSKMSFNPNMIAYFDIIPLCEYYLLVDPASTRKKKSDYTAMLVVGVDCDKRKYIVDGIRDKLDPKQRIDTAIELAQKWNIRESGWEEVGLGDDNFYLEEKRREKQLYFNVIPIKTMRVAKEDKIRNLLLPQYAQHEWLWPKKGKVTKMSVYDGRSYDLTEVMEKEFVQFPMGEHDDLMDCQTFLSQMSLIIPEKTEPVKDNPMTFGDLHKIRENRELYSREHPWHKLDVVMGR